MNPCQHFQAHPELPREFFLHIRSRARVRLAADFSFID